MNRFIKDFNNDFSNLDINNLGSESLSLREQWFKRPN